MLNLLRFKPDGGRERYARYADAIVPFLQRVGGRVVYFGETGTALVAPDAEDWDAVLLVRYPSRRAFCDDGRRPRVPADHAPAHRGAGRRGAAADLVARLTAVTPSGTPSAGRPRT